MQNPDAGREKRNPKIPTRYIFNMINEKKRIEMKNLFLIFILL